MLEVAGREVITLPQGSLIPEGAAAGKARLRVSSEGELYRFRRDDLDLAVAAAGFRCAPFPPYPCRRAHVDCAASTTNTYTNIPTYLLK